MLRMQVPWANAFCPDELHLSDLIAMLFSLASGHFALVVLLASCLCGLRLISRTDCQGLE